MSLVQRRTDTQTHRMITIPVPPLQTEARSLPITVGGTKTSASVPRLQGVVHIREFLLADWRCIAFRRTGPGFLRLEI